MSVPAGKIPAEIGPRVPQGCSGAAADRRLPWGAPPARRDKMARVQARPRPEQWDADEPMTLREAAAVFFPDGPLTLSSLRTAASNGQLATIRVAGKDLTTPKSVRALVQPCLAEKRSRPASGFEKTTGSGSSSIEAGRSAQAALETKLIARRSRSRNTLARGTVRHRESVIPINSQSQTS
jgi:hypothetical protein